MTCCPARSVRQTCKPEFIRCTGPVCVADRGLTGGFVYLLSLQVRDHPNNVAKPVPVGRTHSCGHDCQRRPRSFATETVTHAHHSTTVANAASSCHLRHFPPFLRRLRRDRAPQQSQTRRFMPHAAHSADPASPQSGPRPATVAKAAFPATCGTFRRSCVAPGGTALRNSRKGGVSCRMRRIPPFLRHSRRDRTPQQSQTRRFMPHAAHSAVPASPQAGPHSAAVANAAFHAAHSAVPAAAQADRHPATVTNAAFHAACGTFRRSCVAPPRVQDKSAATWLTDRAPPRHPLRGPAARAFSQAVSPQSDL